MSQGKRLNELQEMQTNEGVTKFKILLQKHRLYVKTNGND